MSRRRYTDKAQATAGEKILCMRCGTWIAVLKDGVPVPRSGRRDYTQLLLGVRRVMTVAKCRQCGLVHYLDLADGQVAHVTEPRTNGG